MSGIPCKHGTSSMWSCHKCHIEAYQEHMRRVAGAHKREELEAMAQKYVSGLLYGEEAKMERKFKVGDKVKARNNWPVRIICDDKAGLTPIVGLMTTSDSTTESIVGYSMDGHYAGGTSDHPYDIIPAPDTRTVWITWWPKTSYLPQGNVTFNATRQATAKEDGAVAHIKVEIPEGRFDE